MGICCSLTGVAVPGREILKSTAVSAMAPGEERKIGLADQESRYLSPAEGKYA